MAEIDTYEIAKMYKHLRVCDVGDALDAVGRADLLLVDKDIRPLFLGTKFWGVAVTERALPANKRMPVLTREQATQSHRIWFQEYPRVGGRLGDFVKPGSVVCTDASQCGEVGIWGSNNSLEMIVKGAVGIVSDGYIRDTAELKMTNTPVVSGRAAGRSSQAETSSRPLRSPSASAACSSDLATSSAVTTTACWSCQPKSPWKLARSPPTS